MKKLFKSFVFILSLSFASSNAYAKKGQWTKLKKANVYFKTPRKWKSVPNFLGLPLILLSPMKNKSRITISITPTGLKKKFLINEEMKATQNNYKKGRIRYVKEIQGEITGFFEYETRKWKNVERVHTIGFKYKLGGHLFVERTYYFTCKTQMFHMKSKYREGEYPKGDSTIDGIVKSFNCK